MVLRDFGTTVLIVGLIVGAHFLAKSNSLEYELFVEVVKDKISTTVDNISNGTSSQKYWEDLDRDSGS